MTDVEKCDSLLALLVEKSHQLNLQREQHEKTNREISKDLKLKWEQSGKTLVFLSGEMRISVSFLSMLLDGKRMWTAALYSNFRQALLKQ